MIYGKYNIFYNRMEHLFVFYLENITKWCYYNENVPNGTETKRNDSNADKLFKHTIGNIEGGKMSNNIYRNHEGYPDITAGKAIREADRLPAHVRQVMHILRLTASLAGFDIKGRITLKDKTTGKEW